MKKFFTLLLVLTGMVTTVSAWNGFFKYSYDSWASSHDLSKFNNNELYVVLPGDVIKSGALYFKPCIESKGWLRPDSENKTLTTNGSGLGDNWKYVKDVNEGDYYYIIPQNANASKVYIYVKTNDNADWWSIAALVYEEGDELSYTINYYDTWEWGGVKVHTYFNDVPLNNAWPGTEMSGSDRKYSVTFSAKPGTRIIFNQSSNSGNQTSNFELVNKGYYDYDGLQGITASISSVGYATFSSTKAVDFTSEKTIEACKASVDGNGKITYTPVTSVAAGEGVLLRRADRTIAAASSVIPLNDNQSVARNDGNDLYGITAMQKIAQSTDAGYTNFVLAKPSDVLGFFKVNNNGSWCAAGTAYLKVANGNLPAASREFFALDDETTGIEAVDVNPETVKEGAREYYNLNGQRVMNPSKGLYIVNGKKVIIK